MPSPVLIAEYAGVCPVCGDGYAVGRSEIRALAAEMPPNPAVSQWYPERQTWLVHGQPHERMHRRSWAHRRCADRLDKKYTVAEQIALAEDWREELRRLRREGDRAHERRYGRRRQRRSRRKKGRR